LAEALISIHKNPPLPLKASYTAHRFGCYRDAGLIPHSKEVSSPPFWVSAVYGSALICHY